MNDPQALPTFGRYRLRYRVASGGMATSPTPNTTPPHRSLETQDRESFAERERANNGAT